MADQITLVKFGVFALHFGSRRLPTGVESCDIGRQYYSQILAPPAAFHVVA
jgi:hypothetical protein